MQDPSRAAESNLKGVLLHQFQMDFIAANRRAAARRWNRCRLTVNRPIMFRFTAQLASPFILLICALLAPLPAAAIDWKSVEDGFDFAKYELGDVSSVIRSEVYLLRFDPQRFTFSAIAAEPDGDESHPPAADLRTLTKQNGGIAGINANFFDEKGNPLGLLIDNSEMRHKMHRGGKVITGVFAIRATGTPVIEHRDSFKTEGVSMAVQAGPRLIADGKLVPLNAPDETSRRSGIAITKKNTVILYATVLRFPGATLGDIQGMLLDPSLEVVQALNLDGGGSSQLFVESFTSLSGETFITGGDPVPVGIVVRRKNKAP